MIRFRKTARFLAILLLLFAACPALPEQAAHAAANPVIFRGLFVGCGNYKGKEYDLAPGTINDANECCYVFSNAYYDGVSRLKGKMGTAADIRKSTLINHLNPSNTQSVYYGADSNDVSIFFFSGHGTDYDATGSPAIVLSDGKIDETLSVDALEAALHKIPGTKVVILDSCFSGAMIGNSHNAGAMFNAKAASPSLAPSAVAASSTPSATPATPAETATTGPSATAAKSSPSKTASAPPATAVPTSGHSTNAAGQAASVQNALQPFINANKEFAAHALLSQPEYIVITASSGTDYSYGESGKADAMGCFTRSFTDGLGRLGQFTADSNSSRSITVQEAYQCARRLFSSYYSDELGASTAKVYPANCSFQIMAYVKAGAAASGIANRNTSIYSSTSSGKTALRSLSSSAKVSIYGILGGYYKVSAQGTYGYVPKNHITITSGSVGSTVMGTGKTTRNSYIYATASTSGSRIWWVGKGNTLDILGVIGSYYLVSAGGVAGCIPASSVQVTSGFVGAQPTSAYVLATGKAIAKTCLYRNASTASTVVRALKPGATMTITSASSAYYRVWTNGYYGYVPTKCVSICSGTLGGAAPKSVNTSINTQGKAIASCYAYSSPSATAKKQKKLYSSNRVTVLSVKGGYYKVKINGLYGYVPAKSISIPTFKALSAAGQATAPCKIYAGRSPKSAVQLRLDKGAYVSILGVCGDYYKVTVSGAKGYIPVKYISVL